ncbi:hypothetical protein DFH27DRAFT_599807 [Peziza echinospora]|nr:hypothetical protein DFH27DRAFT_599807 [Peziza echinospora]
MSGQRPGESWDNYLARELAPDLGRLRAFWATQVGTIGGNIFAPPGGLRGATAITGSSGTQTTAVRTSVQTIPNNLQSFLDSRQAAANSVPAVERIAPKANVLEPITNAFVRWEESHFNFSDSKSRVEAQKDGYNDNYVVKTYNRITAAQKAGTKQRVKDYLETLRLPVTASEASLREARALLDANRTDYLNSANEALIRSTRSYWTSEISLAARRIEQFVNHFLGNVPAGIVQRLDREDMARFTMCLDQAAPEWRSHFSSKDAGSPFRQSMCLRGAIAFYLCRYYIEKKVPDCYDVNFPVKAAPTNPRPGDSPIPRGDLNPENTNWVSYIYYWIGGTPEYKRNWLALTNRLISSEEAFRFDFEMSTRSAATQLAYYLRPFTKDVHPRSEVQNACGVIIAQWMMMASEMIQQPNVFFFSTSRGEAFTEASMLDIDNLDSTKAGKVAISVFPGVRCTVLDDRTRPVEPIFAVDLSVIFLERVSCYKAPTIKVAIAENRYGDINPGSIYGQRPGQKRTHDRKYDRYRDHYRRATRVRRAHEAAIAKEAEDLRAAAAAAGGAGGGGGDGAAGGGAGAAGGGDGAAMLFLTAPPRGKRDTAKTVATPKAGISKRKMAVTSERGPRTRRNFHEEDNDMEEDSDSDSEEPKEKRRKHSF